MRNKDLFNKLKFDFKNGKTNIRVRVLQYLRTFKRYVKLLFVIKQVIVQIYLLNNVCMIRNKKLETKEKYIKRAKNNVYNCVNSQECKYFLTKLDEILKMIDVSCIYSVFILR